MATDPAPLAGGSLLGDRFSVQRVLGRGGFGIAYLARDEGRGDLVVVKELAPLGVRRSKEGILDLEQSGSSGHMLRHRFLQEAQTLRRLRHPGIPTLRAAFAENGTAYYVTDYLPGGRTLEDQIRRDGPLREDSAREIFTSLLDILETVHAAGVLHRDVKPTNILLGPAGEVVLLDFGSARDWASGAAITHTVMHTPGYAPPEQLSERAARGAATDLYALCATMYHALVGEAPPTAPDRMAGIPLVSLSHLRPGLDPILASAIEAGLEMRMADRPESVEAMRARLADEGPMGVEQTLHRLDDTLCRLRDFRFDRRACPACQGMLIDPKPLRRYGCPVCRDGVIRPRDLDVRRCPQCRVGTLVDIENGAPLAICPKCGMGRLSYRRRSLLATGKLADCQECAAHFEIDGDQMAGEDYVGTADEWRLRSGRGHRIKACEECQAQFDETADGRWRQVSPPGDTLYWEEWTRIAEGLSPAAGNAACDQCRADFWNEEGSLTLLDAARDPFDFAARFVGRPLDVEHVRWVGAGKYSPEPGLVCEHCATEFDREGSRLRLVNSPNRRLARHVDENGTLEDWHRIAQDLPTARDEAEVAAQFEPLLLEAYTDGEISLDEDGTRWRGRGRRLDDDAEGTLVVTNATLRFGGRWRGWHVPLTELTDVEGDGEHLSIAVAGQEGAVEFRLNPITLTAHLRSGRRSVILQAEHLADRLARDLERAGAVRPA